MDKEKISSASDIVSGSRKKVTNPDTGHTFEIRRISPVEFMSSGLLPLGDVKQMIAMTEKTEDELAEQFQKNVESMDDSTILNFLILILCKGVTSIRVVDDLESNPEAGIVNYADLDPTDQDVLVKSIIEFSGITLGAWGLNPSTFR